MPVIDSESSVPSTSDSPPATLQMFAARILPGPPQPVTRAPRPDDPTPRKPPAYVTSNTAKRKRERSYNSIDTSSQGLKRTKSVLSEDEQVRRAREVMFNMPKSGVPEANSLKRSRSSKGPEMFKVPPLPARSGSTDTIVSDDVFG